MDVLSKGTVSKKTHNTNQGNDEKSIEAEPVEDFGHGDPLGFVVVLFFLVLLFLHQVAQVDDHVLWHIVLTTSRSQPSGCCGVASGTVWSHAWRCQCQYCDACYLIYFKKKKFPLVPFCPFAK